MAAQAGRPPVCRDRNRRPRALHDPPTGTRGATVQFHLATLKADAAWRIRITVTVTASTGTLRDQANAASVIPGPAPAATPPSPPPRKSLRRSPGRPAAAIRSGDPASDRASDIRAWAKQHGIAISARGRIPASVAEQYRTAATER